MQNYIDELNEIIEKVQKFLDRANKNENLKKIKNIFDVSSEVEKSWSGSWIGYQSHIYYRDLIPIPAGAHFSSEWGGINSLANAGNGEWQEYNSDYIQNYILDKAGKPNLSTAYDFSDEGKNIFEESVQSLNSIITIYLENKQDNFIKNSIEKLDKLKIQTGTDYLNNIKPNSFSSRDSLAMSQGLKVPPHKHLVAKVYEILYPISACEEFAKNIKIISSHLERQNKKISKKIGTNIFIGHGSSPVWKELKDFVQDRLKLPWDEFNRVPIAGITNINRLSQMLDSSAFAFLIMTAEDEQIDGKFRARMNVIHEAGLFQGRLGFERAIILLEDECEEFSNVQGLGQIRFHKGDISSKFEEIRRVLEREGIIEE